jgi:hypothetical protein
VILCLYAVVATAPVPLRVAGMRNEPMTVIRAGRISGVVGRLATEPRPSSVNLRAYHQAIDRLSAVVPALLPVRFGTTLQSEAEAVTLLRARSASFRTALTRVRRRVQMTARFVRRDLPHPDVALTATPASRSSGTAYLQSRASVARRLATWEPCAELRRVARRWIRAEVIEERDGVVSVYHLVPRAAAGSYRRAAAAGTFATHPRVTGPFPPFAFVDPRSTSLPVAVAAPPRQPSRIARSASRLPSRRGASRG